MDSALFDLNEDLLIRILSFITHDSDRKAFRLVCKAFLRVDSFHRTHLRILRPEFITTLFSKFPRIYSLDLSVCPQINDGAVSMLVGYGLPDWSRRLRRLVLSRTTGLKSAGLEILMKSCPVLESIDVSYCWGFGDREAAALSFGGSLRDVKLDRCLGLTDVGLAKIAIGCQCLEKLSLMWCIEITDLGFLRSDNAKKYVKQLPQVPKQPFSEHFPDVSPLALDLAEKMLVFDPAKRITVEDALNHPFMISLHEINEEPVCTSPFNFDFEQASLSEEDIKELIWNEALKFDPDTTK